jgi:AcrR family transcriptional regulator
MTRQRLNRVQSREQTRDRLLDAAHGVFTKKGFAVTSVEDIATAAGYTRGAFYSNFGGKSELFFELLTRESVQIDLEFRRIFESTADVAELEQKLVAYYSVLYRDDMCSLLWIEAKVVAIRDAKFRAKLNLFLTERYAQIAQFVETFATLSGTELPAPSSEIAVGLMALCEGISFAHRSDPQRISHGTSESVLGLFLRAVIYAKKTS